MVMKIFMMQHDVANHTTNQIAVLQNLNLIGYKLD